MIDTHSGIIAWFARNGVAANLLMLVIILTGLASAFSMRTQVMPIIESDRVSVDVYYPGASPKEVESGVITRLEEAVREIEGIDEMNSYSKEGIGSLRIDVEAGYDVDRVLDEVKLSVDRISAFPEQIEKPRIFKSQRQMDAIRVQVYGDLDEKSMKMLTEGIRDEILELPSVTSARLMGARPYEISIEVKENRLRQYGLSLERVAQAIRRSSLDLPAGAIKSESGDILLRTQGQAYRQKEFEDLVLLTNIDGTRLTLGDVAEVSDGFAEVEFYAQFDQKPSMGIQVFAVGNQNQLVIADEVKKYVEARKSTLPDSVHMSTWADSAFYLGTTLDMMLDNLIFGIALVFIVLSLFLRIQLAFWVIVGLPICFLGAFAALPLTGVSINMISLFGFILVLGIVVDDAIIIGESAQTFSERDGHSIVSVIAGAKRVAMPATFGVLTTIAAFSPLLMVSGPFSAMPEAIAWVVVLCLAFSLVESKLILPAHLSHMRPLPTMDPADYGLVRRVQSWFSDGLKHLVLNWYRPFLVKAIEHRYTTLALFLGMLLISIAIVISPYVKVVFFPNMPSDFIMARVELVDGAPTSQTVRIVKDMTRTLNEINDEYPEQDRFIRHVVSFTGGVNGTILAEVTKGGDRKIDPEAIAQRWREAVGEIAGAKSLQISGSMHAGGDTVFNFRLLSNNNEQLREVAEMVAAKLKSYDGVYDVENSGRSSIQEINLSIKPSAEVLGLTLSDLASQVRAAFYGVEAQRIQRGRNEIRVMVRYPRDERVSMGNLETMYIRTPDGTEVPFSSVANINLQSSYSDIVRAGGRRAVVITANAVKETVQPGVVVKGLQDYFANEVKPNYPDVSLNLGGSSLREQEMIGELYFNLGLALFTIYALMAIPLKSYVQPIIIMAVIPFGMIGALAGHILVGIPFSALSLYGIAALAGVVVNDSIIMVDFVNKAVDQDVSIFDAVINAGTERFRAILLTSLTTFFGLVPMLLEETLSAQFVIPMAVSLGFGILFGTVITLLLIPSLYVILDDMKLGQWLRTRTAY